jgi:hypothetical protein
MSNFLSKDFFEKLSRELPTLTWTRHVHVRDGYMKTRTVDLADWAVTPVSEKFSDASHASATDLHLEALNGAGLNTIAELLKFAVHGSGLRKWLEIIVGRPVVLNTWEMFRYEPNGFLSEHQDTHDTRICSLNFYLDASAHEESGGHLVFRDLDSKQSKAIAPLPNSVSLFPIGPQFSHQVTHWREESAGRETLSLSFRAAG